MTKARRPQLYVILALKRKYALLKGEGADLFAARERIATDMGHLGAVLAMFAPDIDLAAIPAIRTYRPRQGRWNRTALKILRQANAPMRGRDLTRRVMTEHGLDLDDYRTMDSIETSLLAVLKRLERRGFVVATGKPRRWAVAGD